MIDTLLQLLSVGQTDPRDTHHALFALIQPLVAMECACSCLDLRAQQLNQLLPDNALTT